MKDIDAALVRKSETSKLKIICHQMNIWVKGAGWRDVRTPFSRNNVKFGWVYLLENLKEIIVNHMQGEQRRDVQEMVPRPTQLSSAYPMPSLRDELCDVLRNKEVALADKQKRLNDLHDKEGIPRRREKCQTLIAYRGRGWMFSGMTRKTTTWT